MEFHALLIRIKLPFFSILIVQKVLVSQIALANILIKTPLVIPFSNCLLLKISYYKLISYTNKTLVKTITLAISIITETLS
jgi:hypothetical protein